LTLESLARAFGVSVEFIDRYVSFPTLDRVLSRSLTFSLAHILLSTPHSELSRFISTSRLHARIDRVNGIVETTRPSLKTMQYEVVVKQGDVLLNEVQRLSKVLY
jgi:26S proteasome regulatory subunit N7